MQAVGTVAGVVAAVIGLWYINATLNVTKDALHRSERPWLEITPPTNLSPDSVKEGDVPIGVAIQIANSGKGPAVKLMACFGFRLYEADAPAPIPFADPTARFGPS